MKAENDSVGTLKLGTNLFIVAGILLFFAVALGAFGAHGLEGKISEKAFKTFQTGNRYHFFHSFALLIIGIIGIIIPKANLKASCLWMLVGILLFSFNCYIYAITSIKIFAMIVPLGGVSFLVGWFLFIRQMFRVN